MNRIKGILYAAVSSSTFGLAPFFSITLLLAGFSAFEVLSYRWGVASIVLIVFGWLSGCNFRLAGKDWGVGGEKWKYNGWFGCCLCFCFFIRRVYCWSADNASRTNKLYGIDLLCYGVGNYFLPHRRLLYFRTSTCVGWIYLADYSWAGITGYGYFQYNFSTSY